MTGFSDIVGKRGIVESMLRSIKEDRVGHAYILTGPEGIGKKTLSMAFASLLLCKGNTFPDPCGHCMPCRLIPGNANPDLMIIDGDGKSIGVELIRELQHDVVVRPMYSDRKVYIINNADKMTLQAQNCLLKTLEEPPSYAVIILNASNMEALLATVKSRATAYMLKKNTDEEVREFLVEKYGGKLGGLDFIVAYADGIIGTAVSLAESREFFELRKKTVNLLVGLKNSSRLRALDALSLFEENRDYTDMILKMMALFYRDMLVALAAGNERLLINSDIKDIILDNARHYTPSKLIRNIEAIEEASRNLAQNANYQLCLEVMLMKFQEE